MSPLTPQKKAWEARQFVKVLRYLKAAFSKMMHKTSRVKKQIKWISQGVNIAKNVHHLSGGKLYIGSKVNSSKASQATCGRAIGVGMFKFFGVCAVPS